MLKYYKSLTSTNVNPSFPNTQTVLNPSDIWKSSENKIPVFKETREEHPKKRKESIKTREEIELAEKLTEDDGYSDTGSDSEDDKRSEEEERKVKKILKPSVEKIIKPTIEKIEKKSIVRGTNGKFTSSKPTNEKKDKISRDKWDNSCRFISINAPIAICHPKMKKKYLISFKYIKDGKVKQKSVKFGNREIDDYCDHKDEKKKEKTMSGLRKYENPLQPNYWRYHLLNRFISIKEAYLTLLNENNLM